MLTAATTFVCPSVYEPLGIVNLEAMACGAARRRHGDRRHPRGRRRRRHRRARADRAAATTARARPVDPDAFVADLAAALTEVVSDPTRPRAMGEAGRQRAETEFGWDAHRRAHASCTAGDLTRRARVERTPDEPPRADSIG